MLGWNNIVSTLNQRYTTLFRRCSTLFQLWALTLYQRCGTLKIRHWIFFHFQRRINVISTFIHNVETTLIRRWNVGWGNLELKENKKGMNTWIDKNLIVHWNCSVSSSIYSDLVWVRFDFEVWWFFSLFFWIANVWILDFRTFDNWICLIWTDLILVLLALQLLGVVNFVVLIWRHFPNKSLRWRLMVKIWKLLKRIGQFFTTYPGFRRKYRQFYHGHWY